MMNNKKGPVRIEKDTLNNIGNGKEAMKNDHMAKAWLNYFNERQPKGTKLKVAKKCLSKQKFPCHKYPKIWNCPMKLRRHLMVPFKPKNLDSANSSWCTF